MYFALLFLATPPLDSVTKDFCRSLLVRSFLLRSSSSPLVTSFLAPVFVLLSLVVLALFWRIVLTVLVTVDLRAEAAFLEDWDPVGCWIEYCTPCPSALQLGLPNSSLCVSSSPLSVIFFANLRFDSVDNDPCVSSLLLCISSAFCRTMLVRCCLPDCDLASCLNC